jgi:HEAT repeat protein
MFEHLIDFEPQVQDSADGFVPVEKTHPTEHVDAQTNTLDWLKELGAADEFEIATEAQTQAARTAFTNLVTAQPPNQTHKALEQIKTPAAVQHLVGMLTAYDWQFINQAQEIRGYAMAQLLEETKNPSASIRLKALALLGKVTEVGLFTEKIEVKKSEMTDAELEARIKEKLGKMAKIVDITDIREVQEIDCQEVDTNEDASEPHTES